MDQKTQNSKKKSKGVGKINKFVAQMPAYINTVVKIMLEFEHSEEFQPKNSRL